MKILLLILRESLHRPLTTALAILGVASAVTLTTFFFTSGDASKRETTRLMRDMGFNIRIVPQAVDMDRFWSVGFSEETMPESWVARLAEAPNISYAHVVATLQKKVDVKGLEVILTGMAPEAPSGKPEQPMGFVIEPGSLYVGYEVARLLKWQRGDAVSILGRTFTVARDLPESGSEDDIRLYGDLKDVQEVLNLPGQINEIKALQCLCLLPGRDTLEELREQLVQVLPETKVILLQTLAESRKKQRMMAEKYFALIMPIVLVACAAWIGILAAVNVRERRSEIGILRALGYGSIRIGMLFLGKAILIGVSGSVVGFALGMGMTLWWGPQIFQVTAKAIEVDVPLFFTTLWLATGFTCLASFVPSMLAVVEDPAEALRQE